MKTLTEAEVATFLREQPEWRIERGEIVRDWTFPDFSTAMVFVNRVAQLAEEVNHHPDIDIRFNRVRLALISHDASGLTRRDTTTARKLTALFPTPARRGDTYA
jgi:4a-hydroxytetrahydrobiopterin dehydratase